MLGNLKSNLRATRELVIRLRRREVGLFSIFLYRLPITAWLRLYSRLATSINGRVLNKGINYRRFRGFQRRSASTPGRHFYVIVMPRMLHFLVPCLELLPSDLRVDLLVNGAAGWEQRILAERFPHMDQLKLATLPGSSLSHGDMLNLMLENQTGEFGILDHDMYVFDPSLFDQLRFQENECMLGVDVGFSPRTGLYYPLTHFLYFNTPLLQGLMQGYGVAAGIYPSAPERLEERLKAIGLGPGVYLKQYHDYFDTLHLLLCLAYSEGMRIRILEPKLDDDIYHVGGTSLGTHHTKALDQLYLHACFLELHRGTEIGRRYHYLVAPLHDPATIRSRLPDTPRTAHLIETTDRLMKRLRARSSDQGSPHTPTETD